MKRGLMLGLLLSVALRVIWQRYLAGLWAPYTRRPVRAKPDICYWSKR